MKAKGGKRSMKESLQRSAQELLRKDRTRKRTLSVFLLLALPLFLFTALFLSRRGEALTGKDRVLECHYAPRAEEGYADYVVHTHSDDCYNAEGALVCPLPEIPAHVHDESCWSTERVTVCSLEESSGHRHGEGCYSPVRVELICELAEEPGHTHSADCYAPEQGALICGQEERSGHVHGDACYAWSEELSCDLEEGEGAHTHTDACFETVRVLACGKQELHTHTDACRDETGTLVCGLLQLEEHVHGPGCFIEAVHPDDAAPRTVTLDGGDFRLTVSCGAEAAIPADAAFVLEPLTVGEAYESYRARAMETVRASLADDHVKTELLGLFDLSIFDADGNKLQPAAPVTVRIELDAGLPADEQVYAVHFTGRAERPMQAKAAKKAPARAVSNTELIAAENDSGTVSFTTDGFSVYAIVGTTIEKQVLASDGHLYKISVRFGPEAGLPEDAALEVSELSGDACDDYLGRAASAMQAADFAYARVFDISVVDADGTHLTPGAPVQVTVALLDANGGADFSVVHFEGEQEQPERLQADTDGNTVSFSTESFSAYAIVQGPAAMPLGWLKLTSLDALRAFDGGLYIGTTGGYYAMDQIIANGGDYGIRKSAQQNYPTETAALYRFEPAAEPDQFYIYCVPAGQYVQNAGDQHLRFTDEPETAFTVDVNNSGAFRFHNGDRYWNMWKGPGGSNFAAYDKAGDGNNYFYLWYYDAVSSDPYDLDGKSYGLMFWNNGTTGKAMMASSSSPNSLDALVLTIMAKTGHNEDKLFVPNDSEISMWTFQWLHDDLYTLSTVIDGNRQYLKVAADGLRLVDTPDASCELQLVPGTGAHTGEICLKSGSVTLTYSGVADNGFTTGGSVGSEWLRLVTLSELTSDYFLTYSASKVSVSDPGVTNGSRIIVYTRAWNEETKKYEFYAIDHDGSLVRCYESGDSIQWVSERLNSLLWNFVEYYWEDTSEPNYYYELYNSYSEKYIAPQVSGGQILSDDTIGINMNGRRNLQYYSPIVAWDDGYYAYAGLKVEGGKIVSCPLKDADDFYFAVMQDLPVDDTLNLVNTVDHTQYGITMKLTNFPTRKTMSDFLGSDAGGAVNNTDDYLLSTNLVDGYPVTRAGNSLADWFADAPEVNHLFIDSTYHGTGYFEYDATQNFASLDTDGNFKVYQELGTMDSENRNAFWHGQFMPYNDLQAGRFTSVNRKNTTTAGGAALPESDPRKYEQMYLVQNPDFYFGTELSATFTQTPDGLDDWGHDIIYEFTGDDDFWLYVDGELIIDLGGIHNALSGSVNYRTGEVVVNGRHTTLRDLFYSNYIGRGLSEEDALARIDEIFEQNDSGQYIFKDYTTHTMKIFYMERGAGASNLHMRFNLASIKPGTVQLSKQLSGVDATESILAEFAYQIRYRLREGGEEFLLEQGDLLNTAVFYKDTANPVKYLEELTIDGIRYENVFMLKPGETAEINFPEGTYSYSIAECGVNTDVYSGVRANGTQLEGTAGSEYPENRRDFPIGHASPADRARVTYTNEVNPEALRALSFTKRLFKENGIDEILYPDDLTTFSFRLYLAAEFGELDAANMHTYHVKDPDGNYCRWDADARKLVPLGEDRKVYTELEDWEKEAASFTSSMNGTISNIPVGFTVEVREVLAGTHFQLVERPWEVPDGYSFQRYVYREESFDNGEAGVTDTVIAREGPHIDVCNLKGWGLRVNKIWLDADYMAERDVTYFAVFTSGEDGALTLVNDTVRRLSYQESTLYWYFRQLPVNVPFEKYEIREVTLSGEELSVDADGLVTGYDAVTPLADGAQITLSGKQKGESESSDFRYTVLYERGELEEGSNVRVDTVTNNRPGIVLKKQDWSGNALAGASFTLTDGGSLNAGYTSDFEGLITVAFLRDDVDYTLTETAAPRTYHGLEAPMTIRLHEGTVSVSGVDAAYYTLEADGTGMPTLIVKNRPFALRVVKQGILSDGSVTPLSGAAFALHRAVTVGDITDMFPQPLVGYENLISGDAGLIPDVDETLDPRIYYLVEKAPPAPDFLGLDSPIRFTVSDTGAVTLTNNPMASIGSEVDASDGTLIYTITVRNLQAAAKVRIVKIDQLGRPLEGAVFTLRGTGLPETTVTSQKTTIQIPDPENPGEMMDAEVALIYENTALPFGSYTLTETAPPSGYHALAGAVEIVVETEAGAVSVSAAIGGKKLDYPHVAYQAETGTWTIQIMNQTGYELPNSGGPGTALFGLLGAVLTLGAGALLLRRKKGR